jgi:hypothetical protein
LNFFLMLTCNFSDLPFARVMLHKLIAFISFLTKFRFLDRPYLVGITITVSISSFDLCYYRIILYKLNKGMKNAGIALIYIENAISLFLYLKLLLL